MDAGKRKRIGLALSGGVARGPAHIGVLLVLAREGIPIDCVTGTSAGSLIGALYCAGFEPARMQAMSVNLSWRQLASVVGSKRGLVSFAKLERWLIRLIGDVQIADLPRPFAAMATDLHTGLPVTLYEGRLAAAVQASCSVPGFVTPVEWDGRLLGDGGVSCNLPVAAARTLGADYVIGVDLMQPALRVGWGPFGFGFAALETLIRRSSGELDSADCLIVPELAGATYFNFGKRDEMIALGMRAAEAKLPLIRSALTGS